MEVVDSIPDAVFFVPLIVVVRHRVACDVLSFRLKAESLSVIELGIDLLSINCVLKLLMRLIELRLIQINVSQVEVVVGILFVVVDGCLVLIHGLFHIALMVVCQTQILVVEGQVCVFTRFLALLFVCFELDRLLVSVQGPVEIFGLKLR